MQVLKETFQARYASLPLIGQLVTRAAEAAGFDERDKYAVQLAVDEACTNIIEHAYGGEGDGQIDCTCHVSDDDLKIVLRDSGRPFDLKSVPDPDLDSDLQECRIGGIGLHFIYQLMDDVCFEFTDAGNILTIVKRGR